MEQAAKYGASGRDLLIVDDDPAQASLFRHFLVALGHRHRCHHVASGLEALAFLHHASKYTGAPRPDLIILDLNMPGMNGCEVLSKIKSDPDLRPIPVIMFSSDIREQDVNRCYWEHANAYVRKPGDYDANLRVIEQIEHFWFRTAELATPSTSSRPS